MSMTNLQLPAPDHNTGGKGDPDLVGLAVGLELGLSQLRRIIYDMRTDLMALRLRRQSIERSIERMF